MTAKETKRKETENLKVTTDKERNLVLHNDDVHSFDYVIQALMEICDHDYIQASQCTIITHYKGKCEIKSGSLTSLRAMKKALTLKELKSTID